MDNNNFNLFVCKLFTFNKRAKTENYMASVYYFIIIFFYLGTLSATLHLFFRAECPPPPALEERYDGERENDKETEDNL